MLGSTETIEYKFRNNTELEDAALEGFTQKVLKCIFGAMSTCEYKNFMGNIQMAMNSDGDDEPYYNFEFVSNPNKVMKEDDLDSIEDEDYMRVSFDIVSVFSRLRCDPIMLNGKILFMIRYRTEDGTIDDGMMRAICREASKRLRPMIEADDCFIDFRTNCEEIR